MHLGCSNLCQLLPVCPPQSGNSDLQESVQDLCRRTTFPETCVFGCTYLAQDVGRREGSSPAVVLVVKG